MGAHVGYGCPSCAFFVILFFDLQGIRSRSVQLCRHGVQGLVVHLSDGLHFLIEHFVFRRCARVHWTLQFVPQAIWTDLASTLIDGQKRTLCATALPHCPQRTTSELRTASELRQVIVSCDDSFALCQCLASNHIHVEVAPIRAV